MYLFATSPVVLARSPNLRQISFKISNVIFDTLQHPQLYSSPPGRAQCVPGGSKAVKVEAGPLQIVKFYFGNYRKVKRSRIWCRGECDEDSGNGYSTMRLK